LSAAAEDHIDVDLGDVFVGDVELVQLDVDARVDVVRLNVVQILMS
jgi:hypothetical protein